MPFTAPIEDYLGQTGLTDVTVGILDASGAVIGTRTACTEVTGRPGYYRASVTIPDNAGGRFDLASTGTAGAVSRGDIPSFARIGANGAGLTAVQLGTTQASYAPAKASDVQVTVNPTTVNVSGGFLDADRTSLSRLTGTLVTGQSVFTGAALVNVPTGGLSSGAIAALNGATQIFLSSPYVPGPGPVVVIPAPPDDATLCAVYGYLQTPQGARAAGVVVTFTLRTPGAPGAARDANGYLIAGRVVTATTDGYGRLIDPATPTQVGVLLERPDKLTPEGCDWIVKSAALGLPSDGRPFNPSATTFDLAGII